MQTVTVTCVRSLDLTLQSTISVMSQDGTAVGENSDITEINIAVLITSHYKK